MMNEQRIQAYLNLIQQLLSCPNGEENQILNQSFDLVDEGFVQMCEQVATQIQEEGEENAADFLRNLAQDVVEYLNNEASEDGSEPSETQPNTIEEEYLNFLMEVLQATEDSRGNPSVVYPLLQQNLDKLDLNLVNVLQKLAQKLKEIEENEAIKLAKVIGNFVYLMRQFSLGSPADNLEIVIVCYEIICTVFTKEKAPQIWAALQNDLGIAYSERIWGKRADNLEQAITAYRNALKIYTHETSPENWAMAQSNLGTAYSERIEGKRIDNIEQAIAAYKAALEVYNRTAFSEKWADTQHNLGAAYSDRIQGERANNLEQAIAAYQAALEVSTLEAFPQKWAGTQNTLGNAYLYRIKGERADNLERAITSYKAALEVYTRTAFPEKWAMTQNNLAVAYRNRIKGEQADNLEQAITAYKATLEVYSRTAFPEKWATTQNNLAVAYSERIKGERAENLELAIACYEAALKVYTCKDFPEKWAATQNNLGNAYLYRIEGERAENLERAIACYEAALTLRTREAFPQEWARTQNCLGAAYSERIEGKRIENLEQAIAAYKAALEVYNRTAFPEEWATTQNNLGNVYQSRIKGERADNLKQAIAAYQAALEVRTRQALPQDHVQTLFNLGLTYRLTSPIKLQNAYDTFASAIDTIEEIRSGIIEGGETDKQKLAEKWNGLGLYRNMVEVCLELNNYAAALEYAERSKARNLVELFAATRLKPKDVSSEIWERYDDLYQQWWNLQQRRDSSDFSFGESFNNDDTRSIEISSPNRETVAAEISRTLTQLRQQIDSLIETEITPHDPKFRFGQKVDPIGYKKIQKLVDEQTAIVEWYFTSKGIQAFIVTRQGQHPIPVPTKSSALDALEQLKDEYLTDYLNDNNHWRQELRSYLQRLAKILELDNLISQIPHNCKQLILVPYRFLHLFPLHALPVSETEYLSDKFPQGIRYAPSSQILQLSLREDSTPLEQDGRSLFAIQNPTEDLAYTDIEVEAIQTAFKPATVLPGKAANKTAFNQAITILKETGFAHFSCHGYFNFTNPRISGLILADAKLPETAATESIPVIRSRRGEFNPDECLTLPEIFNLRLRNCRLVALSACETGITDISTTSDEYISILAGFFFAGSRNVLGTLWAVNDVSTAIFMIRFYEILLGETQIPVGASQFCTFIFKGAEETLVIWLILGMILQNWDAPIPVALALKQTQEWMRSRTVAELLDWIKGCQLIKEERREAMCDDLKLGWRQKLHVKRYESPYYWAAFCAVGQ
ncbi:MAG: CHAT domain-containing protein [Phormidium sp.]